MAQLFLLVIAASVVPVCIHVFRHGPLASDFWKAVVGVAFSACMQAVLVIALARNTLTLDYSFRFAIVGSLGCIAAIFIAIRAQGNWRTSATISASAGLVIWAILITLH